MSRSKIEFTRETALSQTPETIGRFVTAAAVEVQKAAEGEVMAGIHAAYATHAAIETGYLNSGRTGDGMTQKAYADKFARSSGAVTKWRRLGRCYVALGIEPESDLGRVLRDKVNDQRLAAAVESEDATEQSVREAAESFLQVASDGTLTSKPQKVEGKGPDVTDGEDSTPAGSVPVGRNNVTTLDSLATLIGAINPDRLSAANKTRLREFAATLLALAGEEEVKKTA
jgi:hypothetical protein